MPIPSSLLAAALLLAGAVSARAVDLYGKDHESLYRIDTVTGAITLVGPSPTGAGETALLFGDRTADGWIHCISFGFGVPPTLYRLDDSNGATTPVHTLSGWETAAQGAAIDPTDGSFHYIVGTSAELRRVDLSSGAEQSLGPIGPGVNLVGLVFDAAGNLYSVDRQSATLWSVNKTSPAASHPVGSGLGAGFSFLFGGDLVREPATGVVWGLTVLGQQLFTVDLQTGVATSQGIPIGGAGATLYSLLPDDPCGGGAAAFGAGCPGQAGFVPGLGTSSSTPCPGPGATFGVSITKGLGGSAALLVFGLNPASVPIGGGCTLLASPPLGPTPIIPLGGAGPGAGSASLNGVLPASAAGATFTMQAFVLDPFSPIGASATNGVQVTLQ